MRKKSMTRKQAAQLYLLKSKPTLLDHLILWLSILFGGKERG